MCESTRIPSSIPDMPSLMTIYQATATRIERGQNSTDEGIALARGIAMLAVHPDITDGRLSLFTRGLIRRTRFIVVNV